MQNILQKNIPASNTKEDQAARPQSNWIISSQIPFERDAEAHGIPQDFVTKVIAQSDINPNNDDFIILADGRKFSRSVAVAFTTNASADWAIEDAFDAHFSKYQTDQDTSFRTQVIKTLLRDVMRRRIARRLPRQIRKFASVAMARYEDERAAQQRKGGSAALSAGEDRLLWTLLNEAHVALRASTKSTMLLFLRNKLDALMPGNASLALYRKLPKAKQSSARYQIAALAGVKQL